MDPPARKGGVASPICVVNYPGDVAACVSIDQAQVALGDDVLPFPDVRAGVEIYLRHRHALLPPPTPLKSAP